MALQFKESRARLATLLGVLQSGDTLRDEVVSSLLGPPPETAGGRKKEYEMFVEAVLLLNNQQKMEDVTCEELSAMSAHFAGVLNNPPEHYETFAHRVFAEEWRTNPRLFLDELLECIRTKPVTT